MLSSVEALTVVAGGLQTHCVMWMLWDEHKVSTVLEQRS
jgi:hypothetical protein